MSNMTMSRPPGSCITSTFSKALGGHALLLDNSVESHADAYLILITIQCQLRVRHGVTSQVCLILSTSGSWLRRGTTTHSVLTPRPQTPRLSLCFNKAMLPTSKIYTRTTSTALLGYDLRHPRGATK